MVRVRKAKMKDSHRVGIHIYKPSKNVLEDAKQDAIKKGFKTIWVHKVKKGKRILLHRR